MESIQVHTVPVCDVLPAKRGLQRRLLQPQHRSRNLHNNFTHLPDNDSCIFHIKLHLQKTSPPRLANQLLPPDHLNSALHLRRHQERQH